MRITSSGVGRRRGHSYITVVQNGKSKTLYLKNGVDAFGRRWNILNGTFTMSVPEVQVIDALDPRPSAPPEPVVAEAMIE